MDCIACLLDSGDETRVNLGYGEDEDIAHDCDPDGIAADIAREQFLNVACPHCFTWHTEAGGCSEYEIRGVGITFDLDEFYIAAQMGVDYETGEVLDLAAEAAAYRDAVAYGTKPNVYIPF